MCEEHKCVDEHGDWGDVEGIIFYRGDRTNALTRTKGAWIMEVNTDRVFAVQVDYCPWCGKRLPLIRQEATEGERQT